MSNEVPVYFEWRERPDAPGTGVMVPIARYNKLCGKQFTFGEQYLLAPVEMRDMRAHRHFFAALHECWKNLAEEIAENFPTSESLRHWALIETGFCHTSLTDVETLNDAKNFARAFQRTNPLCRVKVRRKIEDNVESYVVEVKTAESQSMAMPPVGMGNARFKESKKAVLDLVAMLARTTAREALREGGRNVPPEARERPAGNGGRERQAPAAAQGQRGADPRPSGRASPAQTPSADYGPALPREKVTSWQEYVPYARAWIDEATNQRDAQERYDLERNWRDRLKMPVAVRMELQRRIDDRFAKMGG